MLRKLILFAITSGLAKKGWDLYQARHATQPAPRHVTNRRQRIALSAVPTQPRTTSASDAG